ncbi:hypothetical protein ANN_23380 [Periplaneta americana]|uniref:Oxysterol-binding protein n=1 Tax=Periplaneta americana TaxID=6978 RepID=A0ABQ8SLU4_PERAM|nr:hypothetical protein ANN_23380 [Periplaneta americana]
MVQVVRWYMSAYHAGRKSTVAKKPYNPIIGEVFKCHWDIPDLTEDSSSLVTDGPVPWCTKNQLTFVAEQVSHHPPKLGGSVTITCAKTGYSANVEFLTKPFYGGKKNRISTEVFQPNDRKPFLTVTGEWNGAMEAKWADGRTEMFVDVNKIDVVKKIVRPIADQAENESRRLWKEVTAGLRLKDIERATDAKFALEQKQRDEAKDRKERGLKWETKCAVSSTQKFLVQQHITTSKHQANKQLNSKQRQLFLTQPTTSNVRSEFNIDLCRSLISADIPLYKLKNKVLMGIP